MVKITVRKAAVALVGAALAQGNFNCAAPERAEDGFETGVSSKSAAYSVPSPGQASLKLDYYYSGYGAPMKQLAVVDTRDASGAETSDEFVRVGQKLTLDIPGWAILPLVQDETGSITSETLAANANVKVEITWLHAGGTLAKQTVKASSWKADATYGWPDAITDAFVVPKGATGFRGVIVAESTDGKRSGKDSFTEMPVFGGELPNKHVFFDLNGDTPRNRVLERGAPVAGSELSVAYSEYRADRLVDTGSIDRRIGRVKTYNPRFGTYESDAFGELVHIISVGYDFGGGFQQQDLVKSPISYVRYGNSQETRVHVPDGATKVSMYFHVKTYLVAKYPTYGEVTSRKYKDGEWILVREKWDNPAGAGTNFNLDTEAAEQPDKGGPKRTVVFIKGETAPGQDMFIRGGIDHEASKKLRGVDCANEDGTPNYACALPILHRNMKNPTTKPWKLGDAFLDWYGRETQQLVSSASGLAQGTPADWTTNAWPSSWGTAKSVPVDGYGVEKLNDVGAHLWMLDVDMDCTRAFKGADGNRWFEVKSFISNGPGWEGDVSQAGAPYASANHFAKCGQITYLERGNGKASFKPLP